MLVIKKNLEFVNIFKQCLPVLCSALFCEKMVHVEAVYPCCVVVVWFRFKQTQVWLNS